MKKILILGGSGVLGQELVKYCKNQFQLEVYAPSSTKCNILDEYYLEDYIVCDIKPDIIIHSAAFVDTLGCEKDINRAIDVNVIGTSNVVKCCLKHKCKLVYISSEYVFGGDKFDEYDALDRLCPINVYGKTKAAAEYLVSIVKNYQIIRVPFIKQIYSEVFTNQYCSRYFVEEVPQKIMDNILMNKEKIIHISTGRKKSLYKHYKDKGIKVKPVEVPKEWRKIIPENTTLIDNSL